MPVTSEIKLPDNNYVDYEGVNSYSSGVIIERVLTPRETGNSLMSINPDIVNSLEQVNKEILEKKAREIEVNNPIPIDAYL